MRNPHLIRSVYARTLMQLTLAVLIVFSALAVVYYSLAASNSQQQETNLLLNSAHAISEVVANEMNLQGEINDQDTISYINFTARSTGSIVWVVNYSGEITVSTSMPAEAAAQLTLTDNDYYRLPAEYRATMGAGTSGVSIPGNFRGLFKESGVRWLSVAWPLPSNSGSYNGEVQLHYIRKSSSLMNFMMTGSMIFSFVAAIGIALIFIYILSRNITRPIRLLSQAANQVSKGDLSIRVVLPGLNDQTPASGREALVTDDLTVLVSTVNNMIEKLENQERDRKDFISSVSHDLRTPITSIRGFVEGMLDGTVPADRFPHYLEIVKQESMRLQNLVNTVLDANLLASDRKIVQTVFDINEVIKEDVIGLEPLLSVKKIGVQTDFLQDDNGRLLAIGDREAINRVVYNIITNAIRFTPEEGIIALTTRRSGKPKEIEVIIEDSGSGIPESEYPYIFDRFYKVDKSRTAKGSGLGLYICRTILAAHGQRISVSRSDLGGARFIFTLAVP